MTTLHLNLARKWRSKTFDQIVGQELSLRILKNSLYLDHYFPVYLFSGQRGCGKTSMARIFASALNCSSLATFQQNPKKQQIPCLECTSCHAMTKGSHPDFIEIDAASHTGVDNVRQIIEAASLLPLMGQKKIYLIDEAHMLSKAAFNAFLKILEEPPASVLFILATTEVHKIIDTVTSRSFQLFFRPVEQQALFDHLKQICQSEEITYEDPGLHMIIQQTEGSVRDALNLLEQVRFSTRCVSKKAVREVLGHLDDELLLTLFNCVLNNSPQELLAFLHQNNISASSSRTLWEGLIELIRASICLKYSIIPVRFGEYTQQLQAITLMHTLEVLTLFLQLFYEYEALFLKTTAQYPLLEMLLLQMCQKNSSVQQFKKSAKEHLKSNQTKSSRQLIDQGSNNIQWQTFLQELKQLEDPVLHSIFMQATFDSFDAQSKKITVLFSEQLIFYKDIFESTADQWQPLFNKVYKMNIVFNPVFTKDIEVPVTEQKRERVKIQIPQQPVKKQTFSGNYTNRVQNVVRKKEEPKLDVSDATVWKNTHKVLKVFPGITTEVPEGQNE